MDNEIMDNEKINNARPAYAIRTGIMF